MKFRNKYPRYLSMDSTMSEVFLFAWNSIDGQVTILVSLLSVVFGVLFALDFLPKMEFVNHIWLLLMPVILIFSFLRMRLYTYSDDWFSIICYFLVMLVALSIPFYLNIGDIVCHIQLYLIQSID